MSLSSIINALLNRIGLHLTHESVLYDWQKGKYTQGRELKIPNQSVNYLKPDNPRLLELKKRYASFQSQASVPIVWTDEYLQSLELQSFRGDNCYVWQERDPNCADINYCLTSYYIESIDKFGFLKKNIEDGLFGVHTQEVGSRLISRDLLDSINELYFLIEQLDLLNFPKLNILDIGAGYGRLAYRAATTLSNLERYACTDAVPESTFLSEHHLKFRGVDNKALVIPLDNIDNYLSQNKIDLAVNIHSFSECSMDAIEWWLKLLARHHVPNLFIVPNGSDHGGIKLALNNGEDFSHLVESNGYRLKTKLPKYRDPLVQKYGVSPSYYYLFTLES